MTNSRQRADRQSKPAQHSRRTPQCPSLPRFAQALQQGWTSQERAHIHQCDFCADVLADFWSETCPPLPVLYRWSQDQLGGSEAAAMFAHLNADRCERCRLLVKFLVKAPSRLRISGSKQSSLLSTTDDWSQPLAGITAGLVPLTLHLEESSASSPRPWPRIEFDDRETVLQSAPGPRKSRREGAGRYRLRLKQPWKTEQPLWLCQFLDLAGEPVWSRFLMPRRQQQTAVAMSILSGVPAGSILPVFQALAVDQFSSADTDLLRESFTEAWEFDAPAIRAWKNWAWRALQSAVLSEELRACLKEIAPRTASAAACCGGGTTGTASLSAVARERHMPAVHARAWVPFPREGLREREGDLPARRFHFDQDPELTGTLVPRRGKLHLGLEHPHWPSGLLVQVGLASSSHEAHHWAVMHRRAHGVKTEIELEPQLMPATTPVEEDQALWRRSQFAGQWHLYFEEMIRELGRLHELELRRHDLLKTWEQLHARDPDMPGPPATMPPVDFLGTEVRGSLEEQRRRLAGLQTIDVLTVTDKLVIGVECKSYPTAVSLSAEVIGQIRSYYQQFKEHLAQRGAAGAEEASAWQEWAGRTIEEPGIRPETRQLAAHVLETAQPP